MALKHKDLTVTVGHVPKLLSKITYFYLKHGADLLVKITGKSGSLKTFLKGAGGTPRSLCFQVYKPGNAFKITSSC